MNAKIDGRDKRRGGFTLIEVMATMVIMALVLLPLLRFWMAGTRRVTQGIVETRALAHAQSLMSEIATMRWDEFPAFPVPAGAASSVLTREEAGAALNDDIDDYNGYEDMIDGFSRKVTVEYVSFNDLGSGILGVQVEPPGSLSDYKRVIVTVRRGEAPDPYEIQTIFGNFVQ